MMPGRKKVEITLIILIMLIISGLSAWRALAILGIAVSGWIAGLAWSGLTAGFMLFWLAILAMVRPWKQGLSLQPWLIATIGLLVFGLAGFLLATPAGLSRITLELYAQGAWSPNIFTVEWGSLTDQEGLGWQVPLSLPAHAPVSAALEIRPGRQANGQWSEVWLVSALWPDGTPISSDQFQADGNWQRREVDWNGYQQPVWVFQGDQPGVLSWVGMAPGPLTLTFARHSQAGQVAIQWQGQPQMVELYAPDVEFTGVTLPVAGPVVWRASLPFSALAEEITLSVEPDPGAGFPAVIEKLSLRGLPGQAPLAAGEQLSEVLQFDSGFAVLTSTGLRFETKKSDELPRATLTGSLIPRLSWSPLIPLLENGLLVLYSALIGGITLGTLASLLRPRILVNLNILAITLLLALGLAEIALYIYLPPADKYYLWPPYLHAIFNPDPQILPGITGESHFIINSQGLRGDEFSAEDDYRILAVGGSTTESLYLDQTEAWPQLLQTMLNEAQQSRRVWVANAGKSGFNSREHVLQAQYLLPQYPDIEVVILLVGGNDFNLRLIEGDSYKPDYLLLPGAKQVLLKRVFTILPARNPDLHYYEQSAVWRLLNRVEQAQARRATVDAIDTEDNRGEVYLARRERRKKGMLEDTLPDLGPGLAEYHRNLNTIIDLAQARQVRLILITQPTLWRPGLTQAEQDLFWLGWQPGHKIFYSVETLRQGMEIYNQKLLEICQQRHLECIDLATALPKDSALFYDEIHFNEQGAAQVARIIADYLLDRSPFTLGP